MSALFDISNLSKTFTTLSGDTVAALTDVSLTIESGEFLTIVGPSGCGKSTLLQILSGIDKQTSGIIQTAAPNAELRIGFVFQANTVFPWRTVEANLAYPLAIKGAKPALQVSEAVRIAKLVGLNPDIFLKKYPRELSGGETRRVAIGMALAHAANVMFMDEPTSQLDFLTRFQMQQTVQKLWLENGFTVVYVTHDIDEAILLGSRVMIMRAGRVKEIIEIALPRPRNKSTLADPVFIKYQEQIMTACEAGI